MSNSTTPGKLIKTGGRLYFGLEKHGKVVIPLRTSHPPQALRVIIATLRGSAQSAVPQTGCWCIQLVYY